MADFINTIDVLGDDVVMDSIIDRTITEFKDDKLTTIGKYAFYGCSELENVNLPNVTTMDGYSLGDNKSIKEIYFPKLTSANGAFRGSTGLIKADLPELTDCVSTFFHCSNLAEVNLPKVRRVHEYGLSRTALTTVYLPSCTALSGNQPFAFAQNLKYVDLPVCTSMVKQSFWNCTSLTTLILRSQTVCSLANVDAFTAGGTYGYTPIALGTGYIYVPAALIEDYQAATNWSTYAAQFRALEDYTVDGTITGELDETKI